MVWGRLGDGLRMLSDQFRTDHEKSKIREFRIEKIKEYITTTTRVGLRPPGDPRVGPKSQNNMKIC